MESMPKGKWNKWRDTEAEAEAASTEAQERCTMPPAQSAERHVRSHSNPMDPGRFTAAIAIRSISPLGHPEDTDRMGQDLGNQTCKIYFSLASFLH